MEPITDKEITERLETLGYSISTEEEQKKVDERLISFCNRKGSHMATSICHITIKDFPEDARELIIDLCCGEFLKAKRAINIDSSGQIIITKGLKSIKEGSTEAQFETGREEQSSGSKDNLDKFADWLTGEATQLLLSYRKIPKFVIFKKQESK